MNHEVFDFEVIIDDEPQMAVAEVLDEDLEVVAGGFGGWFSGWGWNR